MSQVSAFFERAAWRTQRLADAARGVDFLTAVQPSSVGLDASASFRSSPSGGRYLRRVLEDLNVTPQDAIVDVGCGKGSAMRTMLEFPFCRVDGIEVSGLIAAVAASNFKRLGADRATVYLSDAAAFRLYDVYSFVCFYNPFPGAVMETVVTALAGSLQQRERHLTVIYNNPTCNDALIHSGLFERVADYPDQWGNGIAVYCHGESRLRAPSRRAWSRCGRHSRDSAFPGALSG